MRRLGSALGVEAMSLYRHFLSKAVLLEAVVGRLLAELLLPVPGSAPWQDAFRALARDYRQLLLRHPNAIPLLATLQLSNPGALGAAGAVMALLRGVVRDRIRVLGSRHSRHTGQRAAAASGWGRPLHPRELGGDLGRGLRGRVRVRARHVRGWSGADAGRLEGGELAHQPFEQLAPGARLALPSREQIRRDPGVR